MWIEIDVEVFAETFEVADLELLHIDMTGVPRGQRTHLRAQILYRLHQVIAAARLVIVGLEAHDGVLPQLVEAACLEQRA